MANKKKKDNKKVFIIGAAADPDSIKLTRETFPAAELWSVNNLFVRFQDIRFDRWFELHQFARFKRVLCRRGVTTYQDVPIKEYMAKINALDCPVYMQRKWPQIKRSREYPFREIMEKYGRYFGCSFAWMMALALEEGFKEIVFRGVLLVGKEYYYQRPSVEYLIGLARGRGINVAIGADSMLLEEPWVYACEESFGLIDALFGKHADAIATTALAAYQIGLVNAYYSDSGAD